MVILLLAWVMLVDNLLMMDGEFTAIWVILVDILFGRVVILLLHGSCSLKIC